MKHSRRLQRGFTLIEIMVVTVIIGILATLVSLSIGNRALDDRMEVEARRLVQVLQLAQEEAEIKGVILGLRFTEEQVQLLALDEERKWSQYAAAGPLRSRALPQPFTVELFIEGRAVPPASALEDGADSDNEPQVLLLSSGEVTAFGLNLRAPGHQPYFRLDADALGQFVMTRKEGSP